MKFAGGVAHLQLEMPGLAVLCRIVRQTHRRSFAATGVNKQAECQDDPAKGNTTASLVNQVGERCRNRKVGESDEAVGDDMGSYQSWFSEVTVGVWQAACCEQGHHVGRPNDEGNNHNERVNRTFQEFLASQDSVR